jgi:hypothetical protein
MILSEPAEGLRSGSFGILSLIVCEDCSDPILSHLPL